MESVAASLLEPAASVWGVRVAVAPVGRPLTENITEEGKFAPRVGVARMLTVSDPPGTTEGGEIVPIGNAAVKVKSSTDSAMGVLATVT